ncbi:MAG: hypothetical protein QW597_00785 [Thermoplasmataceae archaeon]
MRPGRRLRILLFVALEAVIFFLFFSVYLSGAVYSYWIYVTSTPIILIFLIYLQGDIGARIRQLVFSRDVVVLLTVLFLWYYLYAVTGESASYLTVTFYAPVLLEELNFRYVVTSYLSSLTRSGMATIIQAFLYAIFYSSVLIATPGAYPGFFAVFYLIDMFSIGLIYGVIYYFRKNIYLDMAIHFTLWAMIPFTPAWLAWLPYSMAPA